MKTLACGVLILIACGAADAQTTSDLQIRLGAHAMTPYGGELPSGVQRSTGPVVIGKVVSSTYSFGSTCEAWAVSTSGSLIDNATSAWRIEITPLAVVQHAVRFRLRWVRADGTPSQLEQLSLDERTGMKTTNEDIELNLGPGESWLVDTVRVPPGARMVDGRPCGSTASIRVSVDRYPSAENEHRLIGAELWLVERTPDGREVQRSEPLVLRGLPGRPFNFYFDSIADANAMLDIYGILYARRLGDEVWVTIETRSRWAPEPRNISGPQRFLNSEIHMKPPEVVEIRLPPLGDEGGVFAKRTLSIRIRARQLR
jgi:hypothetical protein